MNLPNPNEIEFIVKNQNNHNNIVLEKILSNVKSIKQIEKENIELKKGFVENQQHINNKKIDDLIEILNHKELKFREFHKNILEDYKKFKENTDKLIVSEKEKNNLILKKYKELILYVQKIKQENNYLKSTSLKTKFLLKKDFEKRINKILDEHEIYKNTHKNIVKEHEEFKLDLKKQREIEREKSEFLAKKNHELLSMNEEIEKKNNDLVEINKRLLLKINQLNHTSIGNKKILDSKIESMRKELEDKLRDLTKQHLDKEIEYRAIIGSLKKDLSRYYSELNILKEKYFKREKELKEKIKLIFPY